MADIIADYALETSSTTGTGTYSLNGAVSGLRTLVAALGTGVTGEFVARTASYSKWERFRGVLTDAATDTITRAEILESSNGNAAVDWQAGDLPIYIHCIVSAARFSRLRARHRSATAPDNPLQAGMEWVDISAGVTAVVEKYYDGTDWITRPWTINETANTISFSAPTAAGDVATKAYVDVLTDAGGARLTLTTALPVTTSDVTAATTIFITPYLHNVTKLWDGTRDVFYTRNEISMGLDSNSGHTGYHQQDKNFDVFEYVRSAAVVIGTGPAWSSDTGRADALGRKNGRLTNNASIVLRFGTSSGDTESVAANLANYIGTIRCTANGQTEDSAAKRFCWNMYNRVPRSMRNATETADSWSYTTATIRQANANTANQLDFVRGLDEGAVEATAIARWANDTGGGIGFTFIGLDSTSAAATGCQMVSGSAAAANAIVVSQAQWRGFPGLGRHILTWLERGNAAGTHTWSGDGGGTVTQSGINGMVMA